MINCYNTSRQKILLNKDCILHAILIYHAARSPSTMCDWTHEEMKEKETVSAKAKAKDIENFEKKEERPLTTIS